MAESKGPISSGPKTLQEQVEAGFQANNPLPSQNSGTAEPNSTPAGSGTSSYQGPASHQTSTGDPAALFQQAARRHAQEPTIQTRKIKVVFRPSEVAKKTYKKEGVDDMGRLYKFHDTDIPGEGKLDLDIALMPLSPMSSDLVVRTASLRLTSGETIEFSDDQVKISKNTIHLKTDDITIHIGFETPTKVTVLPSLNPEIEIKHTPRAASRVSNTINSKFKNVPSVSLVPTEESLVALEKARFAKQSVAIAIDLEGSVGGYYLQKPLRVSGTIDEEGKFIITRTEPYFVDAKNPQNGSGKIELRPENGLKGLAFVVPYSAVEKEMTLHPAFLSADDPAFSYVFPPPARPSIDLAHLRSVTLLTENNIGSFSFSRPFGLSREELLINLIGRPSERESNFPAEGVLFEDGISGDGQEIRRGQLKAGPQDTWILAYDSGEESPVSFEAQGINLKVSIGEKVLPSASASEEKPVPKPAASPAPVPTPSITLSALAGRIKARALSLTAVGDIEHGPQGLVQPHYIEVVLAGKESEGSVTVSLVIEKHWNPKSSFYVLRSAGVGTGESCQGLEIIDKKDGTVRDPNSGLTILLKLREIVEDPSASEKGASLVKVARSEQGRSRVEPVEERNEPREVVKFFKGSLTVPGRGSENITVEFLGREGTRDYFRFVFANGSRLEFVAFVPLVHSLDPGAPTLLSHIIGEAKYFNSLLSPSQSVNIEKLDDQTVRFSFGNRELTIPLSFPRIIVDTNPDARVSFFGMTLLDTSPTAVEEKIKPRKVEKSFRAPRGVVPGKKETFSVHYLGREGGRDYFRFIFDNGSRLEFQASGLSLVSESVEFRESSAASPQSINVDLSSPPLISFDLGGRRLTIPSSLFPTLISADPDEADPQHRINWWGIKLERVPERDPDVIPAQAGTSLVQGDPRLRGGDTAKEEDGVHRLLDGTAPGRLNANELGPIAPLDATPKQEFQIDGERRPIPNGHSPALAADVPPPISSAPAPRSTEEDPEVRDAVRAFKKRTDNFLHQPLIDSIGQFRASLFLRTLEKRGTETSIQYYGRVAQLLIPYMHVKGMRENLQTLAATLQVRPASQASVAVDPNRISWGDTLAAFGVFRDRVRALLIEGTPEGTKISLPPNRFLSVLKVVDIKGGDLAVGDQPDLVKMGDYLQRVYDTFARLVTEGVLDATIFNQRFLPLFQDAEKKVLPPPSQGSRFVEVTPPLQSLPVEAATNVLPPLRGGSEREGDSEGRGSDLAGIESATGVPPAPPAPPAPPRGPEGPGEPSGKEPPKNSDQAIRIFKTTMQGIFSNSQHPEVVAHLLLRLERGNEVPEEYYRRVAKWIGNWKEVSVAVQHAIDQLGRSLSVSLVPRRTGPKVERSKPSRSSGGGEEIENLFDWNDPFAPGNKFIESVPAVSISTGVPLPRGSSLLPASSHPSALDPAATSIPPKDLAARIEESLVADLPPPAQQVAQTAAEIERDQKIDRFVERITGVLNAAKPYLFGTPFASKEGFAQLLRQPNEHITQWKLRIARLFFDIFGQSRHPTVVDFYRNRIYPELRGLDIPARLPPPSIGGEGGYFTEDQLVEHAIQHIATGGGRVSGAPPISSPPAPPSSVVSSAQPAAATSGDRPMTPFVEGKEFLIPDRATQVLMRAILPDSPIYPLPEERTDYYFTFIGKFRNGDLSDENSATVKMRVPVLIRNKKWVLDITRKIIINERSYSFEQAKGQSWKVLIKEDGVTLVQTADGRKASEQAFVLRRMVRERFPEDTSKGMLSAYLCACAGEPNGWTKAQIGRWLEEVKAPGDPRLVFENLRPIAAVSSQTPVTSTSQQDPSEKGVEPASIASAPPAAPPATSPPVGPTFKTPFGTVVTVKNFECTERDLVQGTRLLDTFVVSFSDDSRIEMIFSKKSEEETGGRRGSGLTPERIIFYPPSNLSAEPIELEVKIKENSHLLVYLEPKNNRAHFSGRPIGEAMEIPRPLLTEAGKVADQIAGKMYGGGAQAIRGHDLTPEDLQQIKKIEISPAVEAWVLFGTEGLARTKITVELIGKRDAKPEEIPAGREEGRYFVETFDVRLISDGITTPRQAKIVMLRKASDTNRKYTPMSATIDSSDPEKSEKIDIRNNRDGETILTFKEGASLALRGRLLNIAATEPGEKVPEHLASISLGPIGAPICGDRLTTPLVAGKELFVPFTETGDLMRGVIPGKANMPAVGARATFIYLGRPNKSAYTVEIKVPMVVQEVAELGRVWVPEETAEVQVSEFEVVSDGKGGMDRKTLVAEFTAPYELTKESTPQKWALEFPEEVGLFEEGTSPEDRILASIRTDRGEGLSADTGLASGKNPNGTVREHFKLFAQAARSPADPRFKLGKITNAAIEAAAASRAQSVLEAEPPRASMPPPVQTPSAVEAKQSIVPTTPSDRPIASVNIPVRYVFDKSSIASIGVSTKEWVAAVKKETESGDMVELQLIQLERGKDSEAGTYRLRFPGGKIWVDFKATRAIPRTQWFAPSEAFLHQEGEANPAGKELIVSRDEYSNLEFFSYDSSAKIKFSIEGDHLRRLVGGKVADMIPRVNIFFLEVSPVSSSPEKAISVVPPAPPKGPTGPEPIREPGREPKKVFFPFEKGSYFFPSDGTRDLLRKDPLTMANGTKAMFKFYSDPVYPGVAGFEGGILPDGMIERLQSYDTIPPELAAKDPRGNYLKEVQVPMILQDGYWRRDLDPQGEIVAIQRTVETTQDRVGKTRIAGFSAESSTHPILISPISGRQLVTLEDQSYATLALGGKKLIEEGKWFPDVYLIVVGVEEEIDPKSKSADAFIEFEKRTYARLSERAPLESPLLPTPPVAPAPPATSSVKPLSDPSDTVCGGKPIQPFIEGRDFLVLSEITRGFIERTLPGSGIKSTPDYFIYLGKFLTPGESLNENAAQVEVYVPMKDKEGYSVPDDSRKILVRELQVESDPESSSYLNYGLINQREYSFEADPDPKKWNIKILDKDAALIQTAEGVPAEEQTFISYRTIQARLEGSNYGLLSAFPTLTAGAPNKIAKKEIRTWQKVVNAPADERLQTVMGKEKIELPTFKTPAGEEVKVTAIEVTEKPAGATKAGVLTLSLSDGSSILVRYSKDALSSIPSVRSALWSNQKLRKYKELKGEMRGIAGKNMIIYLEPENSKNHPAEKLFGKILILPRTLLTAAAAEKLDSPEWLAEVRVVEIHPWVEIDLSLNGERMETKGTIQLMERKEESPGSSKVQETYLLKVGEESITLMLPRTIIDAQGRPARRYSQNGARATVDSPNPDYAGEATVRIGKDGNVFIILKDGTTLKMNDALSAAEDLGRKELGSIEKEAFVDLSVPEKEMSKEPEKAEPEEKMSHDPFIELRRLGVLPASLEDQKELLNLLLWGDPKDFDPKAKPWLLEMFEILAENPNLKEKVASSLAVLARAEEIPRALSDLAIRFSHPAWLTDSERIEEASHLLDQLSGKPVEQKQAAPKPAPIASFPPAPKPSPSFEELESDLRDKMKKALANKSISWGPRSKDAISAINSQDHNPLLRDRVGDIQEHFSMLREDAQTKILFRFLQEYAQSKSVSSDEESQRELLGKAMQTSLGVVFKEEASKAAALAGVERYAEERDRERKAERELDPLKEMTRKH